MGPTVAKHSGAASGRGGWRCTCATEGDDAQLEASERARELNYLGGNWLHLNGSKVTLSNTPCPYARELMMP